MTDSLDRAAGRDLLSELHEEQCAHGCTLRLLDALHERVHHALKALEADMSGEAWLALKDDETER